MNKRKWHLDPLPDDLLPSPEQQATAELVSAVDQHVARQGVETIAFYKELASQDRDEVTHQFVSDYLQHRLKRHLAHLDQVADAGINAIVNPVSTDQEESHDEEA